MKRLLAFLVAVLLFSACGGGEPAAVELTAADSGTTVTLEPGQQIQISLESNPSTGQAVGAGATSLELGYFRSFETENVEGTFSLNAEVT